MNTKFLNTLYLISISICMLLLSVLVAYAEETSELVIKDTSGVVRNQTAVENSGTVEFNLTDAAGAPSSGADITLTNQATGEILHAVSANGVVVFDNVAPGAWVVASNTPSITFVSVSVSTAGAAALGGGAVVTVGGLSTAATVGAVAGGTALIGGATVAIVDSQNNSNNDETPPLSPAS